MEETWVAIPGFEGAYEVSDLGRVRSLPHKVRTVTRSGNESFRVSPGRILRPGRCASGHLSVSLGRNKSRQVHILVLRAFVGPRPIAAPGSLIDVLHLNGDPSDNRLVNLRYGTRGENIHQDWVEGKRKMSPEHLKKLYEARMKKRAQKR